MHKTEVILEKRPNSVGSAETTVPAAGANEFRLLKWNELVSRGDFVANADQGFEPWQGPAGFRADSFVKAIYRRLSRPRTAAKKAA